MRPLRRSSSLSRIAATLGILLILQGLVVLRYKSDLILVDSALPTTRLEITDGVGVTADRLILLVVAVVISVLLHWLYKSTKFGLETAAAAENETVAASLGLNPERIIVGGELARAGDLVLEPIRATLRRSAMVLTRDADVVAAELDLGARAGASGAAALVLRQTDQLVAALLAGAELRTNEAV